MELFWLGVFGTIASAFVITLGVLWREYQKTKRGVVAFAEDVVDTQAAIVEQAEVTNLLTLSKDASDLEREFILLEKHNRTKWVSLHARSAWLPFMEALKDAFDDVDILRVTDSTYARNYTVRVLRGNGVAYLNCYVQKRKLLSNDGTPNFQSTKVDLTKQVDKDGFVWMLEGLQLVIPIQNNDIKIAIITKAADNTQVTSVPHVMREDSVQIGRLTHNEGRLTINYHELDSDDIYVQDLSLCYSPVEFEFEGTTQMIDAIKLRDIAAAITSHGGNVAFFGSPGTGKTMLARSVASRLPRNTHQLVLVSAQDLAVLASPVGRGQFETLLASSNKACVFIVDEAECLLKKSADGIHSEAASHLLGMMDGFLSSLYNASFILTFNAPKSELNPAIFRSGRLAHSFELKPITTEQATKLVDRIKLQYEDLVFDQAKFDAYVNGSSLLSNGTEYASPGCTTIADIMSCFRSQLETELIRAAIEQIIALPSAPVPAPVQSKPAGFPKLRGNTTSDTNVVQLTESIESLRKSQPTRQQIRKLNR